MVAFRVKQWRRQTIKCASTAPCTASFRTRINQVPRKRLVIQIAALRPKMAHDRLSSQVSHDDWSSRLIPDSQPRRGVSSQRKVAGSSLFIETHLPIINGPFEISHKHGDSSSAGYRNRSKPRPPSRCTLHITPRDVLTIFRVGEHPDWLTRLQTGSIDSSGTRVHASLKTREARIPVWSHSC
ncbi:hypothetical protein ANOM_010752 [Aspergillus nomiae NRRL 13137]|uniref:Uncharacterized protein n=1 Tax=Aspergillus nomiae NRRL (strain ATCC 15546 / NRRL 13137 / CBS 260.88 / M93) TaxID=1509407 RepID=A0A0L1IP49_ASPN3|nr:uncharacterized protein ANOM_010752 [Aspergillus nomiae NRRL 13137]KNG81326.1 hypothetical protein ANOM_010752 [Aspergillus nomiae NRRL 13137]